VPLLATALGLGLLESCGGLLVACSLLLFTDAEVDPHAVRQVLLISAGISTIVVFERLVG